MTKTIRHVQGERREEILSAAMQLISEHGLALVSTRDVARAVGVSQPSLYAHFRSANEITEELCARSFARLQARFLKVAEEALPPSDRLHRICRAYVDFGLEEPSMYRIAFMIEGDRGKTELPADSPGTQAGLRAFEIFYTAVCDMLEDKESPHNFRVTQSLWAGIHGLVALLIARPHYPWGDREVLIDLHLQRAIELLRPSR